ncbi:hypothetical protein IU471_06815 [Nocardia elegans]|uniref:hypothetical protein n=1 Tax=Nocardia elegans TaxID=300029 RepID=UPI001895FF29|nr:hypothetical protein [Nocardia elegans]MBF6243293.1 hypothetical protein [Nocardia elegans]
MESRQSSGIATEPWQRYLAWNTAVAEVVYPETDEAVPAYMDLEDEVIRQIAAEAGADLPDPRKALAEAVRAVTVDTQGFSLTKLTSRTRRWPIRSVEAPPCLAFLALTVVAAENMGNSDEGLASTAYYARLARLLGLADDDSALRRHYQHDAEFLWKRVNRWLENLEGERGVPTAFALTHRYVGLPMSQALVREADRQRFPAMFSQFGLSPGMRLAPDDVATYLGAWLTSESSTATTNLRRLWRRSDSHDRIATIAAVELTNWDGAQQPGTAAAPTAGRALLIANMRTGFMGTSLDLSLGIHPISEEMDGHMEVLETAGKWSAISFTPGPAGLWRTGYTEEIDFGSMLEGIVRFRHTDSREKTEYKRFPRQVVPLIYDELQSAYVQTERMQLGVDALILVRESGDTKHSGSAVGEVSRILSLCARPGFTPMDSIDGLPNGWTLFTGVQLFAAPVTESTRFNELVPLARNQLTVAGGLQIPSRIRKWSSVRPPEVRATVQGENLVRVTLAAAEEEAEVGAWESNTGSLVVPLSDLNLSDGDYLISLFTGAKKTPTQQASVRLRSGEVIDDLTWSRAPRLTYVLDSATGIFSASEGVPEEIVVDGLSCDGTADISATKVATNTVFWSKPRERGELNRVSIGIPDPKSCVATGAHHIQLPIAYGGRPPKFIEGECTSCGLVKRFPGWPRNRRDAINKSPGDVLPHISVNDLPVVSEANADWDAALDALVHLGGGAFNSLDNVARQLEGSALFVDNFTRTLEALGHVAIERDQQGHPTRWELAPSCLAQTASGQYKLTGRWSRKSITAIESLYGTGVLSRRESPLGPAEIVLQPLSASKLRNIADLEGGVVVRDAGPTLLAALPRLSDVASALRRVTMPGFESAERFELQSATWAPTGDLTNPGAYRIKRGFETLYVYRDEADVNNGVGAITGVRLAKHLAANATGRTFAFYIARSEMILTPRGCELPGLYERAAVAFSGRVPEAKLVTIAQQKRTCSLYSSIDRASADLLTTLLTT